jgi:hypothetical protein
MCTITGVSVLFKFSIKPHLRTSKLAQSRYFLLFTTFYSIQCFRKFTWKGTVLSCMKHSEDRIWVKRLRCVQNTYRITRQIKIERNEEILKKKVKNERKLDPMKGEM